MGRIEVSDAIPDGAIRVLDHGFVSVEDVLGSDLTVVNAARVSFGKRATEFAEADKKLLAYLAEHKHMSPFRHAAIQFHIKAPEFVMRQWYRHVVGIEWTSGEGRFVDQGWNEISGRYVEYEPEFYVPETFRPQSQDNKQASVDGDLGDVDVGSPDWDDYDRTGIKTVRGNYEEALTQAYHTYRKLIDAGVAKEQARCLLPVCFYTEIYWTVSLHAVAHFVKLRDHAGAQYEIQAYARAIEQLSLQKFPAAFEALMTYM